MKAGPHEVSVLFHDSPSPVELHAVVCTVLTQGWVTFHKLNGDVVSYPAVNVHRIVESEPDVAQCTPGKVFLT